MKKLWICLALAALTACASFSTQAFRTEQTAVNLAYTAYVGWTNYMAVVTVSPQASNQVKQARLKFASTLLEVEALRLKYSTNSTAKPALQSALTALYDEAENLSTLIVTLRK